MTAFPTTFPFPFYTGSSVASESLVPAKYPIALGGHPYVLDYQLDAFRQGRWKHESIPLLRPQLDSSASPAEQSLNPQGSWRRAQDSWHGGAGQAFRDRDGGDPTRFRSSKGLDPWTKYQLSLLPATGQKSSNSNTNQFLVVAGARLYSTGGQVLKYTTDLSSFSTVTSTASATITGIASDGKYVYLAQSASGIYLTNTSTGAAASWITGTVAGVLGYVKGRLMAANGAAIYNITTSTGTAGPTALPTALFTHANSGFTWVGFAEGAANIYAAGYAGDKSIIYRIAVKPDGSALDQPIIAGTLPSGEIVRGIGGYLGFIFLGTDKGVRFCDVDGQGNLQIGSYISGPVAQCFEGQGDFVWFGWTNYDSVSTGLGRLDLTHFTQNTLTGALTPAYASDLMVTGSGVVQGIATFLGLKVFTISALGIYAETTNKEPTGTFDTGLIGYGLPDDKTAIDCHVRTLPLAGSYTVALAIDTGSFTQIGADTTASDTGKLYPIATGTGERFELRFAFARSSGDTTTGPTLTRYTLESVAGASRSAEEIITLPILLKPLLTLPSGEEVAVDVSTERAYIKDLHRSRRVVTLQEATDSYSVQVVDFQWVPYNFTYGAQGGHEPAGGTMVTQCKRLT